MAIVQMKKVSLVILDSEKKESLKKLRKLGVLHLEALEGSSELLSKFKETVNDIDKAVSILDEVKLDKNQKVEQVSLHDEEAAEKAKEIVALTERKKSLFELINQNSNEYSRLSLWGTVDPSQLASLAEKGIFIYLYEIPSDKYGLISADFKTIALNSANKVTRFVLVSETALESRPENLPAEAYEVPLPEQSTEVLLDDVRKLKQEIESIEKKISFSKRYAKALLDYKKVLVKDIEFENVSSGMNSEPQGENDENPNRLSWVSGFIPVDSISAFKTACSENKWAYIMKDPSDDDNVPTKLKNNAVVSLIYPLTDFLDVTPGYNEYDISGWFLLFFCLFFAMIFGDGGYGALIALSGFILLGKSSNKALGTFVTLLGVCTMGWGAATCTWFGIPADRLPQVFTDISVGPISPAKVGTDVANANQKVFCFVLAIIQLSIAHVKGIFRNIKGLRALGDLGALLQIWGMFYVVMSMVVDAVKYPLGITENTIFVGGSLPLPFVALGVLGVGFALNFTFANYEGSVKDSVLESCKNIISVLLGIVNVFSDIVSYIRLWAVALAGAAISGTVNSMAGPMFGKLFMVIFGVVLLVFGHGLNMILNLLSVIVHGVRLNTLEFSQHLGMSWSGTKYRPFSEK